MANLVDYVFSCYETFEQREFCPADALVFAEMSYNHFDFGKAVRLGDIMPVEHSDKFIYVQELSNFAHDFMGGVTNSIRFKETEVVHYIDVFDENIEGQFSATCFLLENNRLVVAFRGTDASLVGWKEDFNMSFMEEVPSQKKAVDYLNTTVNDIVREYGVDDVVIVGHSKGGNLAVYSLMLCNSDIEEKISKVYNFDGPGLKKETLDKKEFRDINDKVIKFIPQTSIIGMIMQTHSQYYVIKSQETGIYQHDGFTWQIEKNDFVYLDGIDDRGQVMKKSINEWMYSVDDDKRAEFIDTVYTLLRNAGANRYEDLTMDRLEKLKKIILQLNNEFDKETRDFIISTFTNLFVIGGRSLKEVKFDEMTKKLSDKKEILKKEAVEKINIKDKLKNKKG